MKTICCVIVLILSSNSIFGQTYLTQKIINKADSVLKSETENYLYPYFKYDSKSYYTFEKRNHEKFETLNKKKETKGNFKECSVRFKFINPNYPWINGYVSVDFDHSLNVTNKLNFDFLPEFLKKGEQTNFISEKEAIKIATDSVLKGRVKKLEATIEYNPFKLKGYYWEISNYLTEQIDGFGNKYGKVDIVFIDPIKGLIKQYWYAGEYGPLY